MSAVKYGFPNCNIMTGLTPYVSAQMRQSSTQNYYDTKEEHIRIISRQGKQAVTEYILHILYHD